jgi:hypothetical protein
MIESGNPASSLVASVVLVTTSGHEFFARALPEFLLHRGLTVRFLFFLIILRSSYIAYDMSAIFLKTSMALICALALVFHGTILLAVLSSSRRHSFLASDEESTKSLVVEFWARIRRVSDLSCSEMMGLERLYVSLVWASTYCIRLGLV